MTTALDVSRRLVQLAQERRENPAEVWGIPYGYTDLDKMTGGIHPEVMGVLMARPAMGKTSLLSSIAQQVADAVDDRTECVRLILCEGSAEEFQLKMVCQKADISLEAVKTGFIGDAEFAAFKDAAQEVALAPIEYLDNPTSLRSSLEWLKVGYNGKRCAWFGVDYLQIHPCEVKGSGYEKVSEISGQYREFTRRHAPGLLLSQMSRNCEMREDKRPMLSDLKESGNIEADASLVLGLYRHDAYAHVAAEDRDKPKTAELLVLKNRHGKTGAIKLTWNPSRTEFTNNVR